jgi:LacI family transcriptional regulator
MKLKEFAGLIGLSPGVVSRALNGYASVGQETRSRVLEAAERLDYTPNSTARRLRTGRSDMIGVLLSPRSGSFGNPFFVDWLQGIDEALKASPYQLVVTTARDSGDELAKVKRLVKDIGVDGMILARTRPKDARVDWLRSVGVPVATLGRTADSSDHVSLEIDHFEVGAVAARHFLAAGHQRIALVNTPLEFNYSRRCEAGFRSVLEGRVGSQDIVILETEPEESSGAIATEQLLQADMPPTAVLYGSDMMAIGGMSVIQERGFMPGKNVAIIGCNDDPAARLTTPQLATFRAPVAAAGQHLANLLLAQLASKGTMQDVWHPEFIERDSCRWDKPIPDSLRHSLFMR